MRKSFKKDLQRELKATNEEKSRLVSIRLPNEVYEEIERIAEESNTQKSKVIIFALRKALGL